MVKKKKKKKAKKTVKSAGRVFFIFVMGIVAAVLLVLGALGYFYIDPFNRYDPGSEQINQCSTVLDASGKVMDYIFDEEIRFWRPLERISSNLTFLVVFSEDDKFYQHEGIDIKQMGEAFKVNIKKKKLARGGSTITQQLVKNMFLNKDKTIQRKLREIPMSLRIEDEMTKRQIIEAYMNVIEWGPGIYGAEAASRYYFDKPASDLTIAQAYFLVMIIPNPKYYSPFYNPKKMSFIKRKQFAFVKRLYHEKKLPYSEYRRHLGTNYNFAGQRNVSVLSGRYPKLDLKNRDKRPPMFESLERYLKKIYSEKSLYSKGVDVRLSIVKSVQKKVDSVCNSINRRHKDFGKKEASEYLYIPVYRAGKIVALARFIEKDEKLINKAAKKIKREGILGSSTYRLSRIPWRRIIQNRVKQDPVFLAN